MEDGGVSGQLDDEGELPCEQNLCKGLIPEKHPNMGILPCAKSIPGACLLLFLICVRDNPFLPTTT